jgi:predicted RNase H-like HicB family nuclease
MGRVLEMVVKRQVHLAKIDEVAIRVRVRSLKGGRFLGTSPDVPGLVAEGRSVSETIEIAQSLARKIVESCREHGDPVPAVFRNGNSPAQEFRVPVMMP